MIFIVFNIEVFAGDEKKVDSSAANANNASMDLSVPDSPAFKILGLTPNKVDRPSSPREFAAAIINGLDTNGNFQSGLALDSSPYLLLNSKNITLDEYQTDYLTRFLSRSQFSFATAKGASDSDKSLKMATGLKLTLWDEGDPRNDKKLMACLKKAVGQAELSMDETLEDLNVKKGNIDLKLKKETDEAKKAALEVKKKNIELEINKLNDERFSELNKKIALPVKECRENKEFVSNLWNKSSWSIGIAPTFITKTGNTQDYGYSGLGAWTSVSYGIKDYAQLIAQIQYRNKEQIPVPNSQGSFFEQDNLSFGSRLRFGTPNFNGNVEGLYIFNNYKSGKKDDDVFRYSAGIEFKVTTNFWLSMNIGSETGNSNGNKLFALGDIKWAYEATPSLAPTK